MSFTVDLLAAMTIDGFVTNDAHDAIGTKAVDHKVSDDPGVLPGRRFSV